MGCYIKAFPWQHSCIIRVVQRYEQVGFHLIAVLFITLASDVVCVKMPSRQQKRRAKRRVEYLQNREDKLESSRVRYNADPEQKAGTDFP